MVRVMSISKLNVINYFRVDRSSLISGQGNRLLKMIDGCFAIRLRGIIDGLIGRHQVSFFFLTWHDSSVGFLSFRAQIHCILHKALKVIIS